MRPMMKLTGLLMLLALVAGCSEAAPDLWLVQGPRGSVYVFGRVHVPEHGPEKDKPRQMGTIRAAMAKGRRVWLRIADGDPWGERQ